MIHVDLPWNPMRLHQRVGRLNRYGQKHCVEVINLRNPDTVESRIWNLLNEKIERIMQSVSGAMDEPENLMELILGLTDNSIYNALFAKASTETNPDSLAAWFDQKTKTFGGESIIQKVQDLIGRSEKFDYQDLEDVPKLDLPDLKPFFTGMLSHHQRRAMFDDNGGLHFKTPKEWTSGFGTKRSYENIYFDRNTKLAEGKADIMGFGHPMFMKAITEADSLSGTYSFHNGDKDLILFKIQDQITGTSASVKTYMLGIHVLNSNLCEIVKDEELVIFLNQQIKQTQDICSDRNADNLFESLNNASIYLHEKISDLGLPFKMPIIQPISAFYKQI